MRCTSLEKLSWQRMVLSYGAVDMYTYENYLNFSHVREPSHFQCVSKIGISI